MVHTLNCIDVDVLNDFLLDLFTYEYIDIIAFSLTNRMTCDFNYLKLKVKYAAIH